MRISDFDYSLPAELIADKPSQVRGTSRLLVLDREAGTTTDRHYADIVDYLRPGDVLVLNDTKVIKARLIVKKMNGAQREIVVLEKHSNDDNWFEHRVMYRGKLNQGDELTVGEHTLKITELLGDGIAITRSDLDLLELTDLYGKPPLPPYIKRDATTDDIERYQTVFADEPGSAAAPTASLNMTDEILKRIADKGVTIKYLTLHVGLGTFMPIRSDDVEGHKMHSEYFEVPADTVSAIKNAQRVVAVGTTVARTLEYCADAIKSSDDAITGEADIFIYPGYEFKIVDALLTNFHAPRSTVLMLAATFAGWGNLKNAYKHAINEKYKLLSYGDSMFVE